MHQPLRRLLRAAFALCAAVAYVLPTLVGAASEVSHELDHLLIEMRDGIGRVDAFVPATAARQTAPRASAAGVVHSHGGAVHEHGGGLARLLVAAQRTQEHEGDAATPTLDHAGHLPAASFAVTILLADATEPAVGPSPPASNRSLTPPLPPPRA